MSQARFRFSPDILRRLGEELNPNPDQGILELVKNAYDADAKTCTVELLPTEPCGTTICVTDDGDGMTQAEIEDGWLVLGRSSKSVLQRTRLGRIPAGNKGLGRLAALRLGSVASVVTRPRHDPKHEYRLDIDWTRFERVSVVDEVGLEIKRALRPRNVADGTTIAISGVSSGFGRMDVKRLARGLLLLADPFGDDPMGFQPVLKSPQFRDLEKLVRSRYFEDAELHLSASLDEAGNASAVVTDWKGQVLYQADHGELRRSSPLLPYSCPKARFDLWVFILDRKTFVTRSSSIGEVRDWLNEFGGVHLYIRGLRVSPYGGPGNDWLDMNLSRVRNPELRPSTNTAIGRIAVDDHQDELAQKTDRSGLVEATSFRELRRFAIDALDWMARRRLEARERARSAEQSRAKRTAEQTRAGVEQAIKQLPLLSQEAVNEQFRRYDQARDAEVRVLRKELQLYRTLSTAGITAAIFAHESRHPVRVIKDNIRQVGRRGQQHLGEKYSATLGEQVERIQRQLELLQGFGGLSLGLIDHEKRRESRIDVHGVISSVLDTFKFLTDDHEVIVTTELVEGNPFLHGSQAAIESIVANLLVNSIKSFERKAPGERKITVRTTEADLNLTLTVLDNGPGIEGIDLTDIWLPGETTDPNGTGLGLTIVRDTARDLGGAVNAIACGELGGAEVGVVLPMIGI